jgi:hypothetical protein
MSISFLIAWAAGPAGALLILVVGCLRHSLRELRFFAAYLIFLLVRECVWYFVWKSPAVNTLWVFDSYWISEFVLSSLRALTIAEIIWRSLRGYPAVWDLFWRVLAATAGLLLLLSLVTAMRNVNRVAKFFYLGLQRLEFMQAILAIALLGIAAHYGIRLIPLYKFVLIGLFLYSVVQVINYEASAFNIYASKPVFDAARKISYGISIGVWTYAFARPVESASRIPQRVSPALYDQFSPEIHARLRELNSRLQGLWHP